MRQILLAFLLLLAGCGNKNDHLNYVRYEGMKVVLQDGHEYVLVHTQECREKDGIAWREKGFAQTK